MRASGSEPSNFGDWWYGRYIEIHFDDLKKVCEQPGPNGQPIKSAAYMFNSKDYGNNEYPIFIFCSGYFNALEPHADVVNKVKAASKDKFNALDMRSQDTNLIPTLVLENGILTSRRFNFPSRNVAYQQNERRK